MDGRDDKEGTPLTREPHLTELEMALLAEEAYDELDAARVFAHLRRCERCAAELRDVSRYTGMWRIKPERFESKPDLIEAGAKLASRNHLSHGVRAEARWTWSSLVTGRRGLRLSAGAAGLLVIIAAIVLQFTSSRRGNFELLPEVVNPIQTAAEAVSRRALIVIPRSERSMPAQSEAYRSGFVAEDESISSSLLYLLDHYGDDPPPRDVAYWLITGFLATGQLIPAHDYAVKAYAAYPTDTEIATLAGLVAYCEEDLDESERILRDVVSRDRTAHVALLNLGVVLLEKGDVEEARRALHRVTERAPDTALARRAGWLLSVNQSR